MQIQNDVKDYKIKNIEWIDFLKAVGINLVVFGHVFENEFWVNWLYSFHMPLFIFASGWLYKCKENKTYIKKKFFTIMIPYFIFGILELLYWQFIEKRFRTSTITFGQAIFGLITGNYALLEFNVHLWFLPCIFIIMVLYNLLTRINKNSTYVITLLISLCSIFNLPRLPFSIDKLPELFVFFLIGNKLAEIKFDEKLKTTNKYILSLISILALAITLIANYYKLKNIIISYLIAFLGTIAFMIISILAENKFKVLKSTGKESLVILCVHGPVYRVLIKIFSISLNLSTEYIRTNIICSIVIVIVTIIISKIIYQILLKIFPTAIGKVKINEK